jgi:hypothetical protein
MKFKGRTKALPSNNGLVDNSPLMNFSCRTKTLPFKNDIMDNSPPMNLQAGPIANIKFIGGLLSTILFLDGRTLVLFICKICCHLQAKD